MMCLYFFCPRTKNGQKKYWKYRFLTGKDLNGLETSGNKKAL